MDTNEEQTDIADIINTNRNKVVLMRKRQPPKCTKILEDILQLRIDAVLNAKVDLKLSSNPSTQEKETVKDEYKKTDMDLTMEESDADNSAVSNEPDNEEVIACSNKVIEMTEISEVVTAAVLAKEAEKQNAIIQLFLN